MHTVAHDTFYIYLHTAVLIVYAVIFNKQESLVFNAIVFSDQQKANRVLLLY